MPRFSEVIAHQEYSTAAGAGELVSKPAASATADATENVSKEVFMKVAFPERVRRNVSARYPA